MSDENLLIGISWRARAWKTSLAVKLSQELTSRKVDNVVYSWDWRFHRNSQDREKWIRDFDTTWTADYMAKINQINWWDFERIASDLNSLKGWHGVAIVNPYDRSTGDFSGGKIEISPPWERWVIIFENTILGHEDSLDEFDRIFLLNTSDKDCLLNALKTDWKRRNPINIASRFLLTTYSENIFFRLLLLKHRNRLIAVNQNGNFSHFPFFHASTYFPVPFKDDSIEEELTKTTDTFPNVHMETDFDKDLNSEIWLIVELLKKNSNSDLTVIKTPKIYSVEKIFWDASGKEFFRLHTETWTFVLMLINWEVWYGSGLNFIEVQKFLLSKWIKVPQIHLWNWDNGYILLEDLGNVRLIDKTHEHLANEALMSKTIEQLAQMRACEAKSINFNSPNQSYETLLWELDAFFRFFFETHLEKEIPDEEKTNIYYQFQKLAEEISLWEKWLILKDVHSKNIMIHEWEAVFIDFQDAQIWYKDYDLASILFDVYNPMNEEERDKHLNHYLMSLEANWESIDSEKLRRRVKLMAIQRSLKWIGSFSSFETRKGNTKYLRNIWVFFGYALENLSSLPEYKELYLLLKKYYYQ